MKASRKGRALAPRQLSPRELKFVSAYIETSNGAESARRAGYLVKNAKGRAHSLLKLQRVAEAIEAGRRRLVKKGDYTLEAAMRQFDEDREFAVKTENATAAVRASELKARLAGHLVDRHDHRMVGGFRLVVTGIDGGQTIDAAADEGGEA